MQHPHTPALLAHRHLLRLHLHLCHRTSSATSAWRDGRLLRLHHLLQVEFGGAGGFELDEDEGETGDDDGPFDDDEDDGEDDF